MHELKEESKKIFTFASSFDTYQFNYFCIFYYRGFITCSHIIEIKENPKEKYNKKIKNIINKSIHIVKEKEKFKLKMIKATAPSILGLPKIHKEEIPIRPIINYKTAPAYKLSKYIDEYLNKHIKLKNNYSVKNTYEYDLIKNIKEIVIPKKGKLSSFDISNMY